MSRNFITSFLLICLILTSASCGLKLVRESKQPIEPEKPVVKKVLKTENLINKTFSNKEGSLLMSILADILDGGRIAKTTVSAEWHGPVEIATETWICEEMDSEGNVIGIHKAVWKNGVLWSVKPYEEKKSGLKFKPKGSK